VLLDLPVTFSMDAAAAGASLPYRWNPEHAPRIGLLPRDGTAGEVRWFDAPSCYVFHTLNAYELDGDRVVVDLVRHPRMFATVLNAPYEGTPTLERWTLDGRSGTVGVSELDGAGQEFPRMDERRLGLRHRFGYTAALGDELVTGGARKHDLDAGTVEAHDYGAGRSTLEPVFVPRSPDAAEDDGWVVSTVYDATTGLSDVVILHAQDFAGDPVATIHLPVRVPFGFHGSWIPDVP
jgi:carotenoid cleavage dioxygenase-like enzyme